VKMNASRKMQAALVALVSQLVSWKKAQVLQFQTATLPFWHVFRDWLLRGGGERGRDPKRGEIARGHDRRDRRERIDNIYIYIIYLSLLSFVPTCGNLCHGFSKK